MTDRTTTKGSDTDTKATKLVMKGFPVTLELPVLWGDMDALRHVNNARYFAWFEAARIAYFDRITGAFGAAGPGLGEVGPILATTSCDYLRPITYPATVVVGVRVGEIGNSSIRMEYEIVRTDTPGDVCARGNSVIVIVRYATLEKVRVPDDVRGAIGAIEAGSG
jgi:acyl-CoA thioester hydrolase